MTETGEVSFAAGGDAPFAAGDAVHADRAAHTAAPHTSSDTLIGLRRYAAKGRAVTFRKPGHPHPRILDAPMDLRRAHIVAIVASLPLVAGAEVACTGGQAASPGGEDAATVCTIVPMPDGGPAHVSGIVVAAGDASPPVPIPGAMIAVEYGGLYIPWCNLAQASPYYVFGTVADANGSFQIDVRQGQLGFHSFANGYFYSRAPLDMSMGTTVTLTMEPLPDGQATPSVVDASFAQATVHAGDTVTFSATLTTWAPTDPLSDENLLVEATNSFGLELNPPGLGKKDDFPNGVWSRSFAAPMVPGTYTYWFSSTTGGCITSNLVSTTLTVQ